MAPSDSAGNALETRQILDELAPLLHEAFAADEWGRLLTSVELDDRGEPVVTELQVDDIVGDPARVEAVITLVESRGVLDSVARAVVRLCAIEGVDLAAVGGATFLRQIAGGFEWLPGLVRVPSVAFEKEKDALMDSLRAKQSELEARFHLGSHASFNVDLVAERIVFRSEGRPPVVARATIIGTWSKSSHTWAWAATNRHLPEAARSAAAAITPARDDLWELDTPLFPVDAATAGALAALVCHASRGAGVYRYDDGRGLIFLLLRDVRLSD
jgi:hypothetical protein